MPNLGDTFLLADPAVNSHLFVILSDPAQDPARIVIASLTSWRADKDPSCTAEPGEHRFVRRRSCVHYSEDRLITTSQYDRFLAAGSIVPQDPLSEPLLNRLLDGAAVSPYLPLGSRQILVEQGLIDKD
jgi:hypothetical protein